MRMISDSWTMISLRRKLPRTIVVEHEKWARVRSHITTISRDVLRDAKSIAHHMVLTRMLETDDFFLFHEPIIEKSEKKSTLFYKVNKNPYPHHRNHRNGDPEILLSCLMIERCLHTKPNTKYSTRKSKTPESFFRNPPPSVDRLHFIEPHEGIGEEIEDDEGYKKCVHIISIFFLEGCYSYAFLAHTPLSARSL